jgi:hypothetical protein
MLDKKDTLSIGLGGIPHVWHSGIFEIELREFELAFANAMHQLNAGQSDRSW